MNSICPFMLRSSSSAHFWTASRMAGSMRRRKGFRSATVLGPRDGVAARVGADAEVQHERPGAQDEGEGEGPAVCGADDMSVFNARGRTLTPTLSREYTGEGGLREALFCG